MATVYNVEYVQRQHRARGTIERYPIDAGTFATLAEAQKVARACDGTIEAWEVPEERAQALLG